MHCTSTDVVASCDCKGLRDMDDLTSTTVDVDLKEGSNLIAGVELSEETISIADLESSEETIPIADVESSEETILIADVESSEETIPISDVKASEETKPTEATVAPDKQLKCSICLDDFREPKIIPCCHTFCKTCLERHHEKSKKKEEFACPECRAKHPVPEGGVGNFLPDVTIHTHSQQETYSPPTSCQECDSGDPVVAYCMDCESHLCEDCVCSHKKLKRFRNHNVHPLDDPDFSIPESPKPNVSLNCVSHSSESLKAYCMSCHKLVCCECIIANHQGSLHELCSINAETLEVVQTELASLINDTRQKRTELEEYRVYVKQVEKVVSSRRTKLQSAINQSFDRLISALKSRQTKLLEEADGICDQQDKELWAQKERIETAQLGLTTALSYTERVPQCSGDIALLSASAQAITRLNGLKDVEWDSNTVEKIQFTSLNYKPTNQEYLQQIGEIDEVSDRYVTVGIIEDLPESIELGVKTSLALVTLDKYGKPVYLKPRESSITAEIFAGSGKKLMATVHAERKQDGSWTLPVTPICGGLNTLKITITSDSSALNVKPQVPSLTSVKPQVPSLTSLKPWAHSLGTGYEDLGSQDHQAAVEVKVDVTGIPDAETLVCKGPDMISYENFDPDDKQIGVIRDNDVEPDHVTVNWPNMGEDKTVSLRWGEDECYDIQLMIQ